MCALLHAHPQVYANDLNPDSAKYLALNLQLNRVNQQVLPFRMDGRQFIRLLLATPGGPVEQLQAQQPEQQPEQQVPQQPQQQQAGTNVTTTSSKQKQQPVKRSKLVAEVPPEVPTGFRPPSGGLLFDHAVMNLPASAVEFLDAFRGAFDPDTWRQRPLPWVHVYTFQKRETQAGEGAWGGMVVVASPGVLFAVCSAFRVADTFCLPPPGCHVLLPNRQTSSPGWRRRSAASCRPRPASTT